MCLCIKLMKSSTGGERKLVEIGKKGEVLALFCHLLKCPQLFRLQKGGVDIRPAESHTQI